MLFEAKLFVSIEIQIISIAMSKCNHTPVGDTNFFYSRAYNFSVKQQSCIEVSESNMCLFLPGFSDYRNGGPWDNGMYFREIDKLHQWIKGYREAYLKLNSRHAEISGYPGIFEIESIRII